MSARVSRRCDSERRSALNDSEGLGCERESALPARYGWQRLGVTRSDPERRETTLSDSERLGAACSDSDGAAGQLGAYLFMPQIEHFKCVRMLRIFHVVRMFKVPAAARPGVTRSDSDIVRRGAAAV